MMDDDRGVSSALSYALILAITVSLTAGLVLGASSLVSDQSEDVARDQIDTVGQRLTSTIMTVDRLNLTQTRPDEAVVTREFPRRVASDQYRIKTVEVDPDHWRLYVESRDADINQSFTVRLRSGVNLEETAVNGGPLRIFYDRDPDPSQDKVRIENA